MKAAAARLPLSLSCAGGGEEEERRWGLWEGRRQAEGEEEGESGCKTITIKKKKKCSPACSPPLSRWPGAPDQRRPAATARTARDPRPQQTRKAKAGPPAFSRGGVRPPSPPPVYFSGRPRRRSLLFIYFTFLSPPSPPPSSPALASPFPASRAHRPFHRGARPARSPGAAIGRRGPVNPAPPPRGGSAAPPSCLGAPAAAERSGRPRLPASLAEPVLSALLAPGDRHCARPGREGTAPCTRALRRRPPTPRGPEPRNRYPWQLGDVADTGPRGWRPCALGHHRPRAPPAARREERPGRRGLDRWALSQPPFLPIL